MWVLLVTLCVIIPPAALKESESVQDIPEGDRKLLIELVKRLQNDKTLGQLDWNESGTRKPSQQARCEVSPRRSSIIKRKDSEKYGAKNLGYFEDVKTNEACADLCCQNSSCDLAVYEDKDRHYCYLFRCEGKCIFSHHSSYISTDVTHHSGPSTTAENTEQDLHRPNEEDEEEGGDDSDQDNEPPAAIPTKPAPATTHASQFIRAHSVGLNGYCRLDTHCEDPNAGCISHECVCQEGYYKKAHICRKVCLPSSFACLELGTIGRGPHCVAGSQVCDGTTQCADGSDEFNCPDTESPFAQDKNGADKSPKQDSESQPSSKAQVAQQGGSSSQDSHKGEKQQTDINGADSGIKDASHNLDEDGSSEPDLPQSVDKAPSSSANSDSMEKEGAVDHKSAATGSDDSLVDEESHDGGLPDKESGKDTQKAEQSASSDGSSYFSKLKLDFTKETASMQGPIIALSLGLAFTVILLVFVACRLRNVRRRLRKGRPLHSNEADYLINGMYL